MHLHDMKKVFIFELSSWPALIVLMYHFMSVRITLVSIFLYLLYICMYICLSHSFPCPIALPFISSGSLLKIQLVFNRFWIHKCLFHSDIGPNFSYCKVPWTLTLTKYSYSTRLPQTDSEEYMSKRVPSPCD